MSRLMFAHASKSMVRMAKKTKPAPHPQKAHRTNNTHVLGSPMTGTGFGEERRAILCYLKKKRERKRTMLVLSSRSRAEAYRAAQIP